MAAKKRKRKIVAAQKRWRDAAGRWRDLRGRYTSPPHTPKSSWPRRRKKAPPKPQPWRPSKARPKPRPPRAKTLPVPRELARPGQVIGQTPGGRPIVVPTLAELALDLDRSERTVAAWLRAGKMPRWALVNVERLLRGGRAVTEKWKHGRRSKWTPAERRDTRDALRDFVSARQTSPSAVAIAEAYAAWRKVKDAMRAALTKKAWVKLMTALGRKVGLPERGAFSIESFILT
jgi:hypothetical protein